MKKLKNETRMAERAINGRMGQRPGVFMAARRGRCPAGPGRFFRRTMGGRHVELHRLVLPPRAFLVCFVSPCKTTCSRDCIAMGL